MQSTEAGDRKSKTDKFTVLEAERVEEGADSIELVESEDSGTEGVLGVERSVTVLVDRVERELPCGTHTTEDLIRILEVDAGYCLNIVDAQNVLKPLAPGQKIHIEESMSFISQVPAGGSS